MTLTQFSSLKTGDLLFLDTEQKGLFEFVRNARMMSVFNVSPHRDSVFLVTEIERRPGPARDVVSVVRAHYVGGTGAVGEAIISAHFAHGFKV